MADPQHRIRVVALGVATAVALCPAGPSLARPTPPGPLEFTFKAPKVADARLQAWLARDRDKVRAKALALARIQQADARKDKAEFHTHGADIVWELLGTTSRLYSLVGTKWRFTGGAHGSAGSRTLLWDRVAGRPLATATIVKPALWRAIRATYCATLHAEQVRRTENNVTDMNPCPPPKYVTVAPAGTHGRFDRLHVVADQYVAGSYAEGPYEIDLPVTPAVLATIAPAWRGDFAVSALPATAAEPK